MPTVQVRLSITAEEMLRWYAGSATTVRARASDGRSVQFPAAILRPFVTDDGVHGTFQVLFDARGRFQEIRQVSAHGSVLRRA